MARSKITTLAVNALASALAIPGVAVPALTGSGYGGSRKRPRAAPSAEQDATTKRGRKNALRLTQAFHDHKPTNHPGREFIGCDERRRELAERRTALSDGSATAARMRHRPDKPRRRRGENEKSRRDRRAGQK